MAEERSVEVELLWVEIQRVRAAKRVYARRLAHLGGRRDSVRGVRSCLSIINVFSNSRWRTVGITEGMMRPRFDNNRRVSVGGSRESIATGVGGRCIDRLGTGKRRHGGQLLSLHGLWVSELSAWEAPYILESASAL